MAYELNDPWHVPQPQAQEFRADLQAAEAKDKKFVKRKTVLKKIVANITMGNDSWYYYFLGTDMLGSAFCNSKCPLYSPMSSSVLVHPCSKSRRVSGFFFYFCVASLILV